MSQERNFEVKGKENEIDPTFKNKRKKQVTSILRSLSIAGSIISVFAGLQHHLQRIPGSPFIRASFSGSCAVIAFILYLIITHGKDTSKIIETRAGFIMGFACIASCAEESIWQSPKEYRVSPILLTIVCLEEHFNILIGSSLIDKHRQRILMWTWYSLRNYFHYDKIPLQIYIHVAMVLFLQHLSAKVNKNYLDSIQQKTIEAQNAFKSTLDLIPHGVLIVEYSTKTISHLNKTIRSFLKSKAKSFAGVRPDDGQPLFDYDENQSEVSKLREFRLYEQLSSSSQESSESGLEIKDKEKVTLAAGKQFMTLYEYIQWATDLQGQEFIFKSKSPKRFLQVIAQNINNGQRAIIFCTDITRVKQVELQEQNMRATFFSSVAHELRTPLNSISPILIMVLDQVKKLDDRDKSEKITTYLNIVMNSSVHLQNVIEDALDISRIENNKFSLYFEEFDIRRVVDQVSDVMKFQFQQKGLEFKLEISPSVPTMILSDQKRFKQVLFNLLGNAQKFTFQGSITIKMEYSADSRTLETAVGDSGIGMSDQELQKLFRFFGTLSKSKDINRGGMGLGLTISKMIIRQLGGEIYVSSQQNVGSQFSFRIPIPKSPSTTNQTAERSKLLLIPPPQSEIVQKRALSLNQIQSSQSIKQNGIQTIIKQQTQKQYSQEIRNEVVIERRESNAELVTTEDTFQELQVAQISKYIGQGRFKKIASNIQRQYLKSGFIFLKPSQQREALEGADSGRQRVQPVRVGGAAQGGGPHFGNRHCTQRTDLPEQVRWTRHHFHGLADARARRVPGSRAAQRETPEGGDLAETHHHHRTLCNLREPVLLQSQSLQELQFSLVYGEACAVLNIERKDNGNQKLSAGEHLISHLNNSLIYNIFNYILL
ncbi:hypothetical protein FGO68_gene3573 [Halteria grandinella]|uniref:histidine kinase n=1 Tax=Halteria grandinella TaxID=5974 RepID=A0A8J8T7A0_HALGN|nr:hypothetical protein FGO68_gene3573 [Halteria grandinella]